MIYFPTVSKNRLFLFVGLQFWQSHYLFLCGIIRYMRLGLASDRSIQFSLQIFSRQKHVKWNIRSFSKFSKISLHLRHCSFNRYGQKQFSEQVSSIFSLFVTNQLGNLYLYASCFLQLSTSRADHQNFHHRRHSYDHHISSSKKKKTEPRPETNKQQFDKIDVVWDMLGWCLVQTIPEKVMSMLMTFASHLISIP